MKSLGRLRWILKCLRSDLKKKGMSKENVKKLKTIAIEADNAIIDRNVEKANEIVQSLIYTKNSLMQKSWIAKVKNFFVVIAVSLAFAVVFRQSFAELYVIPSGSMRPTLKEGERLFVSKLAFGINVPLTSKHVIFDADKVQRTGMVVFTTEGMPIKNNKSMYFIFKEYKRFVKRCMGKPGDSLYFYGGKIYGVDSDGNDLKILREATWLNNIEHVPFMFFDEKTLNATWGVHNYAIARLLTPKEAEYFYGRVFKKWKNVDNENEEDTAKMFLELSYISRNKRKEIMSTIIPLCDRHIDSIWQSISTSRFSIREGILKACGDNARKHFDGIITFENIPDGDYEIVHGQGYKVLFGGTTKALEENHPLMNRSNSWLQKIFNTGIHFNHLTMPLMEKKFWGAYTTNRYAYFRNGDLCMFGNKIIGSKDPQLIKFNIIENSKGSDKFYDEGSPSISDDALDVKKIKSSGLQIPKGFYYCLGDNCGSSHDSRFFGFVPEKNLRGTPMLRIWPWNNRWGAIAQPKHPLALLTSWLLLLSLTIFAIYYAISYIITISSKKPIFANCEDKAL